MLKTPMKFQTGGAFVRYRGMIVSIAAFLVAIAVLMASSITMSMRLREYSEENQVVEALHLASHIVTKDLFSLKLNYGEDPNSPHISNTLKSLKENQDFVNQSLNALKSGGEVSISGSTVRIDALSLADHPEHVNGIEQSWQPFSADINNYLKDATSPTTTSTALDLAILRGQGIEDDLDSHIDAILTDLQGRVNSTSRTLTTLQTAGVIGSLVYFVLFLWFFIRKLLTADQEAEAARRETTEIMDTVNTGLFLLDQDLNISSQYSKELENLIGQSNLGGRNLMDVLAGMISEEDLNTTHAFIGQLYNPRTKERLIAGLNPLNRQPVHLGDKNSVRYLDFKFNRVYQDKEIARVLVGVSDVTDAVLLEQRIEQEREQNDIQLEMLSTILQTDRRLVDDFVRNVKRHNTNINNTLKAPGQRQHELREKVNIMFREVHSMKGEASTLKLHGFTSLAENLETELNRLTKTPSLSGEHFLGLAVYLDELMKLTQTIEDLVSRLGYSPSNTHISGNAERSNSLSDYYTRFVEELAQRNQKTVDFSYAGIESTNDESTDSLVREIAVQLLRNAVVHGIEQPEERQARRKLAAGHVRMELNENNGQYLLVLEDDGKGLDYEAIRAKAVRIGRYSAEEAAALGSKELLSLIFSPGFSTLDVSTEDAGRGVGLDIIKDRISALGGKISVATHAGAYTRFSFTFPKK